jgi:hypothetical protein
MVRMEKQFAFFRENKKKEQSFRNSHFALNALGFGPGISSSFERQGTSKPFNCSV